MGYVKAFLSEVGLVDPKKQRFLLIVIPNRTVRWVHKSGRGLGVNAHQVQPLMSPFFLAGGRGGEGRCTRMQATPWWEAWCYAVSHTWRTIGWLNKYNKPRVGIDWRLHTGQNLICKTAAVIKTHSTMKGVGRGRRPSGTETSWFGERFTQKPPLETENGQHSRGLKVLGVATCQLVSDTNQSRDCTTPAWRHLFPAHPSPYIRKAESAAVSQYYILVRTKTPLLSNTSQ